MVCGIIITLLVVSSFLIGKNSSTQTEKTQYPFVPSQPPNPTPPYQPQIPNSDPTQKQVFINLIKGFVFPTQKDYHEYSNSYFYDEHVEDLELADGITINRLDFT